MTPQPVKKKNTWVEKLSAIGTTVAAGLLLKLVVMFGNFHDDIIKLQKDNEASSRDRQEMHVGINELRLGQYDMNGRLKTVEALLMENNLSQKKTTN